MAETRRLVLLRHGRTEWNAEERAQGHADVPLDELGHRQAERAGVYLAALGPTRLWSSDLTRARQTAEYVATATGLQIVHDPRLREYDLGERSGLTRAEFAVRYPDGYAAWLAGEDGPHAPGEENRAQVRARMTEALHACWAALDSHETGVVVSHGNCLRDGLAALLGWSEPMREDLRGLENCGWAVLEAHPGREGFRLAGYNHTASRATAPDPDFVSDEGIG